MIHCRYYVNVFRIIYLCIIYFDYVISKWSTIFYYDILCFVCFCSFGTVLVALTRIYASLQSDKLDLNIEALNLIGLLTL